MSNQCKVRIGSAVGVYWGVYTYKNSDDLKKQVAESIEKLHPLNSSDEGAEEYRKRFRHEPIFISKGSEKDYIELI